MAEPYLGEIRIVAFNFAPRAWALCDGQLLPINQNQSLYSLLGTTFGGDGRTTFALPDFRGRLPVHPGGTYRWGQKGGEEYVTLTSYELPAHGHAYHAYSKPADKKTPDGNYLPTHTTDFYATTTTHVPMAGGSLGTVGGNMAHDNMPPCLVLTFCIALQGLFPSRN